jgi:hypothetical protein
MACGRAYPSYMGTVWLTPSPESNTIPAWQNHNHQIRYHRTKNTPSKENRGPASSRFQKEIDHANKNKWLTSTCLNTTEEKQKERRRNSKDNRFIFSPLQNNL